MRAALVLARRAGLALALALAPGAAAAQDFRLLVVESPGCLYCAIFEREIAPAYAAAPEGRAAPLVRMRLGEPPPDGMTLAYPAGVTPTFVLIGPDGTERERLIGYPGADFFWGYLGEIFARHRVVVPAS